jgi:translocation and assembly module TamB
MSQRLRRTAKITAIALGALAATLLTLVATLALLLRTEAGSRWLLNTAQGAIDGLTIINPRGNPVDGLQADTLRVETADVRVTIDGLDVRWRWADLLRGFATFAPLHIQKLTVETLGPPSSDPVRLPTLIAPLVLNVPAARVDELLIRSGDTDAVLRQLRAHVRWIGPDIRLHGATLDYQGLAISAAGALRFHGDYGLRLDGRVRHGEWPAPIEVEALGSLRRLRLNAHTSGTWPLAANAELQLLDDHLPLRFSARLTSPVRIDNAIDPLTIDSAELTVAGDLRRIEGELKSRFSDARYNGGNLESALAWDGTVLTADSTLRLADGNVHADCALHTDQPARWSCEGDAQQLALAPWLNGLEGTLSSPFSVASQLAAPQNLQLALPAISGEIDGLPLTGTLQLESPDLQRWQIGEALLAAGPNKLRVRGTIDQQASQLQANLVAPRLAQLYAGVAGSLHAQVELNGALTAPDLHGNASGQQLKTGDFTLDSGSVKFHVAAGGNAASTATVVARGLSAGPGVFDTTVALSGTRTHHQWQLHATQGTDSAGLRCRGGLAASNREYQLDCPTLQGQFAASARKTVVWHNDAPLRARWNGARGEGDVDAFCLRSNPASFCVKPGLRWRRGDLQPFAARLDDVPLRWWRRALPDGLRLRNDPRLHARLDFVSRKPLQANAELRIDASEWLWRTSSDLQQLNLDPATVTAALTDSQARLAAALRADGLGSARAELAVLDPLGNRQLQGQLALADIQLAAFGWAVPDAETLAGRVDGVLGIAGSAQQPQLEGRIDLQDGAISTPGSADTITGINGTLRFADQRGALDTRFRLGEGSGRLTGELAWYGGPDARRVDLQLTGERLRIEPWADSEVLFAPELALAMTPAGGRLTGTIAVEKADIRLAELPPETVSPSRDARVSGREAPAPSMPLAMDIALQLGKRAHFAGFGADVDLTGKLRLRQEPPEELRTTGRITVAKGRYRAYGQRLIVRKGQFIFGGEMDNPDLNLEAIREFPPGNNDVVGLRISGPLRDPVAQLFSDQALTESEIAQYLLTGRKRESANRGKEFSAGGSLLSLGLAGSEGQAAKLAEKFGISGFSMGTAAARNGGTEAEVSGYVFRDLYIRYGRNLGEQIDSVTLQYPLTEKLMIQTISSIEQTVELIYTFTVD